MTSRLKMITLGSSPSFPSSLFSTGGASLKGVENHDNIVDPALLNQPLKQETIYS